MQLSVFTFLKIKEICENYEALMMFCWPAQSIAAGNNWKSSVFLPAVCLCFNSLKKIKPTMPDDDLFFKHFAVCCSPNFCSFFIDFSKIKVIFKIDLSLQQQTSSHFQYFIYLFDNRFCLIILFSIWKLILFNMY